MWVYAVAIVGIAVLAEAAGLGGIPAPDVEIENMLFAGLLLAFIAMMLSRAAKR